MRFVQGTAYLAARGFLGHLLDEVPERSRVDEDLVGCWSMDSPSDASMDKKRVYWTRNVWEEPFLLEFDSISKAAKALRGIQRNWAPYPTRLHRRMALIAEALPPLPLKPKAFPFALPAAPMGSFTLLDEHLLFGSALCSSPFPNGEFSFVEDKVRPALEGVQKALGSPSLRRSDAGPRPALRRRGSESGRLDMGPRGLRAPASSPSTGLPSRSPSPPSPASPS